MKEKIKSQLFEQQKLQELYFSPYRMCNKYSFVMIFFMIILLVSLREEVFSQTSRFREDTTQVPLYKLGIYTGFNLNYHSSDFVSLPGVPNCCSKFSSAFDSGISFGFLFDYTINEYSGLDLRLGYSTMGGVYDVQQNIGNTWGRNGFDTNLVMINNATVNHNLVARVSNITLLPSYRYSIDKLNLLAGLRLGFLSSSSYEQKEELLSPENVVFENGSLTRNVYTGNSIPEANSLYYGVNLGVSYDLNFNKKLIIAPEVRYEKNFSNVNSQPWTISSLIIGAALKYPVYPSIELEPLPIKEETIYHRDTIIVYDKTISKESIKLLSRSESVTQEQTEDYILKEKTVTEKYERTLPQIVNVNCTINTWATLTNGEKQNSPIITVEETEVTESFPILPQVFFSENEAELSSTAQNLLTTMEVEKFDENKLDKNTVILYSNMLNVIANRLKYNPKASIKIVGTNKNKGGELGNVGLSERRALAVKNYFTKVWGIADNRISIEKRNLPQNPGNLSVPEGEVENQRAEIYSNDFNILKPITISKVEKKSNPPVIEVEPIVSSEDGGKTTWDLLISQEGKFLRKTSSTLETGNTYKWEILQEPSPLLETPIELKLTAQNEFGGVCQTNESLTIKQLTIRKKRYELKDDNKIEKYALIIFDFDQSKLTSQHKTILDEIKTKIEPDSKITIKGYTDIIGETNYNENLAKRRAIEVQNYLAAPADKVSLEAVGNKVLLYPNDTPQGRSFCRTVIIEITTPVKP